ncbi:MAG: ATP-binding cassette domain-containing protein [Clostridia bacterium]|nr:ATP-binding cassette domain-containing protein [Clostridia bacterium]
MLELKDLTKTYKPRKGVPIKALQGVSLSFEERGLVFILGRSGSGKSTLLNVVGGLDSVDSGEIIINGRSSKDFKRADYDSYRNTYIGFIFQDYNLLDELTVGENITLALELQNQKVDEERLESILKEVDLEGYADRKPNELSGGQRQRVAIARALVKNPQIIMADEPTGALDEETGIQVLNTLKKMSKDKLVIVVSHDREFAEQYADRIIRLKDGKIGSDTKVGSSAAQTTDSGIERSKEKMQLSRSRLPYRYALKMGANGVWSKPFRLFITILLCMVSFAAFGVVDTFNAFNAQDMALKAYSDSNYEASAYTAKLKLAGTDKWGETSGASLNDIDRLKQQTGMSYVGVTYIGYKNGVELPFTYKDNLSGRNNSCYYNRRFYGYYPASKYFFDIMGFKLIGSLPQKDNEIVITKYMFDQINLGGMDLLHMYIEENEIRYWPETLMPDASRTAQSVIEQEMYIDIEGHKYWKIVGILDTNADKNGKFDCLKPSKTSARDYDQELLESECIEYFRYGYHSIGYISQDRYDAIVESHVADVESWEAFGASSKGKLGISLSGAADISDPNNTTSFWGVASDKDLDKVRDIIWVDGKERATLNDNEYIIGLNTAINLLQNHAPTEREIFVTLDKTYFDGIISFKEICLYDLYFDGRNDVAKYIACYEEAENLEIEKLNIFKEYVLERIDAFPKNTNSGGNWDSWMYPDNVVEYVLGILYSAATNGVSHIIRNDEKLEYDLSKLEEHHWRMMYAGFLLNPMDFGGYFDWSQTIFWEMDCGYNSNLTGGRCGKDVIRTGQKAVYLTKKLQTMQDENLDHVYLYYLSDDFADFTAIDTDANIVGIYVPQDDFPQDDLGGLDAFVFNNKMYESMKDIEPEPFCFLLAPMPKDSAQLAKLINVHYADGNRVLRLHDGVAIELDLVQAPLNKIRGIILIIGLGLAMFSIIMMSNYIGTSVSNKKRDIGILRALGAKAEDIFAIFVNESLIIAMINAVLSILVTVFVCMGLNVMIMNMTQVGFTVLFFGIRQIAIMIIISVAIAVIASLIPIYKMSRKKPIDCIRNR